MRVVADDEASLPLSEEDEALRSFDSPWERTANLEKLRRLDKNDALSSRNERTFELKRAIAESSPPARNSTGLRMPLHQVAHPDGQLVNKNNRQFVIKRGINGRGGTISVAPGRQLQNRGSIKPLGKGKAARIEASFDKKPEPLDGVTAPRASAAATGIPKFRKMSRSDLLVAREEQKAGENASTLVSMMEGRA